MTTTALTARPPALPPTVPPRDILQCADFISTEEAAEILDLLDNNDTCIDDEAEGSGSNHASTSTSRSSSAFGRQIVGWQGVGYERKRRMQRYNSTESSMLEERFGTMMDRIVEHISSLPHNDHDSSSSDCAAIGISDGKTTTSSTIIPRPTELVIEERAPSSFGGVDPTNKWSSSRTKLKNRSSGNVDNSSTSSSASNGINGGAGDNGDDNNPLTNWSVTTFEADNVCGCTSQGGSGGCNSSSSSSSNSCGCYVAQLTIGLPSVQRINKPKLRDVECWDLASSDHYAKFVMGSRSLTVKRGEVLNQWRNRVDVPIPTDENNTGSSGAGPGRNSNQNHGGRSVVLTFRCINEQQTTNDHQPQQQRHGQGVIAFDEMPPLSDLLTIIVTTSPIKSNPSTELLKKTFDTFHHAGHEFAYDCRKVIVCDGCRVLDDGDDDTNASSNNEKKDSGTCNGGDEKKEDWDDPGPGARTGAVGKGGEKSGNSRRISRKHSNVKQALRNGIATKSQAERYEGFKEALRQVCEDANSHNDDAESGTSRKMSPFRNTEVVELPTRHGYGFALRHALRHYVETPYVCVIQHDRTFMRMTPLKNVVLSMMNNPRRIKYVGCSMRSNLMYRDIFVGKYGKTAHEELGRIVLFPPELRMDPSLYGPEVPAERIQVYGPHVSNVDKLHKNLRSLAENYKKSTQNQGYINDVPDDDVGDGLHQLSLTPTLFWYDNTHIVETAHYRDFIFNEKYRMVARGGFVEDKLSPVITKSVERLGLAAGHAKFGCYLLDDHSGLFFTGHLDGGAYITTAERGQLLSNRKSCSAVCDHDK